MNYRESANTFDCRGETLVGIVSAPEPAEDTGVLIAVGGPQYRAGSHRQFTLLARQLAQAGYPTLRFDYRGMGDSTGEPIGFEATAPDIEAAIAALFAAAPNLRRIVLWGLCDAASAALLYWQARRDPRVAGLCLLNPWVRSEATYARAQVKHYYRQRLLSAEFWRKLLSGGIAVGDALREAAGKISRGFARQGTSPSSTPTSFQQRMAAATRDFPGPILLILSENDLTAREFLEHAGRDPSWRGILDLANVAVAEISNADHTFSAAVWREQAGISCESWLRTALAPTDLKTSGWSSDV